MSKTFKDKANYYRHHMRVDNPYFQQKEKYKIAPEDVPESIKPMLEKLNYDYNTALRHGNQRKSDALSKVIGRRCQRASERVEFKRELASI